jgi:cytochrome c-type biogenesis protein CcmH
MNLSEQQNLFTSETMVERRSRRSVVWAVLLGVALIVAFVIGAQPKSPSTITSRAHALEADIRCPSCEDISVATSESSSSIAVRKEIVRDLRMGQTTTQIEQQLVDQYGSNIVLRPPTKGLISLVWFIPLLVAVVALSVVGVIFYRRSQSLRNLSQETRSDL